MFLKKEHWSIMVVKYKIIADSEHVPKSLVVIIHYFFILIIESKIEDYTRVHQPFNKIKDETFEADYHKENIV